MIGKKTIKVTPEHIELGSRKSARYCPISRAVAATIHERNGVQRRLDITYAVHTAGRAVALYDLCGPRKFEARLPDVADKFVNDFDANKPVQPIEFELEFKEDDLNG